MVWKIVQRTSIRAFDFRLCYEFWLNLKFNIKIVVAVMA